MGRFRNYAIDMGSGAMIYILSIVETGSGVQKLGEIHGHRQGDVISLLLFFQKKIGYNKYF
jgi:hypothetical protein